MPRAKGLLAKTHVAAVEPQPQPYFGLLPELAYRLLPAGGANRFARTPAHVQTQTRARRHADQRRMTSLTS